MSDRKQDETIAADFLMRHDLDPQRLPKSLRRDGDNPDFEVFQDGCRVLFCEVKTDDDDDGWLRKVESSAPVIEHVRDGKYTFNRFTAQIHKAAKQFDAVNADLVVPNVLIFVNRDEMCLHSTLIGTLTGNFYAEGGRILPMWKKYSEGRIKTDKTRIHLFVWLDHSGDTVDERITFNAWDQRFYDTLCDLFSVNAEEVHPYADQQARRHIH